MSTLFSCMKTHHTKTKGDLGVLKAQVSLAEQGYLILTPHTEHAPFDLVIYKDNMFKRVQVKYRTLNKLGQLAITFKNYWSNKRGTHSSPSNIAEMDIICIYCADLDKCIYIKATEVTKSFNLVLRIHKPKNNQKKNIKLFSDYLQVP